MDFNKSHLSAIHLSHQCIACRLRPRRSVRTAMAHEMCVHTSLELVELVAHSAVFLANACLLRPQQYVRHCAKRCENR